MTTEQIEEIILDTVDDRYPYDPKLNAKAQAEAIAALWEQEREGMEKVKEERDKLKEEVLICHKHANLLGLLQKVFELIEAAHKQQKPLMTRVGLINIIDGIEDNQPLVSLWAGVGDTSPIERIRDLLNERDQLRATVQRLEGERKWIAVSERLPDSEGWYIIHEGDETEFYMGVAEFYTDDHKFYNNGFDLYPTHWMNYPSPPTPATGEKGAGNE